jgi:hypothetical protein
MRKVDKNVTKKELEQQMQIKNDQIYKEFMSSLALKKEEEEFELKRKQQRELDEIKATQSAIEHKKLEELYAKIVGILEIHQQAVYKDFIKKNYENTKKLLQEKQTKEQTLSQNMFDYFNTTITEHNKKIQAQTQKYYDQRLSLLKKEANKDIEATIKKQRKSTLRNRTQSASKSTLPSMMEMQIALVKEKEIALHFETIKCAKIMQTTAWIHAHELQLLRVKHQVLVKFNLFLMNLE